MRVTTLTLGAVAVVAGLASACLPAAEAFLTPPGATRMLLLGQRQHTGHSSSRSSGGQRRATIGMKYVPDGLSPEQWKKMQKEEAEKKKKMGDLGQVGVKSFKSRSFQAWQESGAGHLFPVDPKKVKSGEISEDKIPYMQRKGAWDNSDLAKKDPKVAKKQWSSTDKAYGKKPATAAEKKAAAAKAKGGKGGQQKDLKVDDGGKKKGLFGLW